MIKKDSSLKIVLISIIIFIAGQLSLKYGVPYLIWLSSPSQPPVSSNIKNDVAVDFALSNQTTTKQAKNKTINDKGQPMYRTMAVNSSSPYDIQAVTKLYETFAGFITTLLTIISVLGVWFAYIIRKNIKELETEIREKGEKQIGVMKTEMETWTDTFTKKMTAIEDLEKRTRTNLNVLEEFLTSNKSTVTMESPSDKAKEIDEDEALKKIISDTTE